MWGLTIPMVLVSYPLLQRSFPLLQVGLHTHLPYSSNHRITPAELAIKQLSYHKCTVNPHVSWLTHVENLEDHCWTPFFLVKSLSKMAAHLAIFAHEDEIANHPMTKSNLGRAILYWLVVDLPLWKIWIRQLGSLFPIDSQYMEK